MRFAIPLAEGKLTMHFGHCENFAIIDTDESGTVTKEQTLTPPPHEPGVLPKWLGQEIKATTVLAGGMGQKAQDIIKQYGCEVIVGCEPKAPLELVADYFSGNLTSGSNACDH